MPYRAYPYSLSCERVSRKPQGRPPKAKALQAKPMKKKTIAQACRYFQAGKCKYGAACKFDHSGPNQVLTTSNSSKKIKKKSKSKELPLKQAATLCPQEQEQPKAKLSSVPGYMYGLWLRGWVKGEPVSLQFINTSFDNLISRRTVERLGLATTRFQENFKVAIQLEGGSKMTMKFSVIDMDMHDFIVGYELMGICSVGGKGLKFTTRAGVISSPFHIGPPIF